MTAAAAASAFAAAACPPIDQTMEDAMAEVSALPLSPARSRLSLPRLIKLCAKSSSLSLGEQLHALSFKLRLSSDLFLQTSLISLYSACGHTVLALQVFDEMPLRNAVAWTAASNACLHSGSPRSALSLFCQMLDSGTTADSFSLAAALSACSQLCALNPGRAAHAYAQKAAIEISDGIGSAIIDMYCKCGSIDDAVILFSSIPIGERRIQTWNAMIHGLAIHGQGETAGKVFEEMLSAGAQPNEITFIGLLCACVHAGMVEEGRLYFDEMTKKHGIEPGVKHYGCMVDLLGRSGKIDEAYSMIMEMRVPPNHVVWGALLSACRVHGDVRVAEQAMEKMKIGGGKRPVGDTSHFVILSNMYRAEGMREEMASLREMVGKKPKGVSRVEAGGEECEFGVGGGEGASGEMWKKIRLKVEEMDERVTGKKNGGERVDEVHGEKKAVAFGLIRSGAAMAIRISKNLRICEECHVFMKLVSEAYGREIVARDCNRFHRFVRGQCSCRDYW